MKLAPVNQRTVYGWTQLSKWGCCVCVGDGV